MDNLARRQWLVNHYEWLFDEMVYCKAFNEELKGEPITIWKLGEGEYMVGIDYAST